MLRKNIFVSAFTLIEIMVVVGIIAILATVIGINVQDSGAQSRDAERQADLRNLQNAIELYKLENGFYPLGCRGANQWSGQIGTDYACPGGSREYIIGLAPKYIKVLPIDGKLNGTNSGYIYTTNAAPATVYKIKAHRTVESEVVTYQHSLKACDIRIPDSEVSTDPVHAGFCHNPEVSGSRNGRTPGCAAGSEEWEKSYALWGGVAPLFPSTRTSLDALTNNQKAQAIRNTTAVICM